MLSFEISKKQYQINNISAKIPEKFQTFGISFCVYLYKYKF